MAAAPKSKNPSWNQGDDLKLLGLFNQHRDDSTKGVDPDTVQDKIPLDEIRQKHFNHIPYVNFRINWKKKSAQYRIDQTLHGANKPDKNDNMPPKKKSAAAATATPEEDKKHAATATTEDDLDSITEDMHSLSVANAKMSFSITQTMAFMSKYYVKNNEDVAELELLCPPIHKDGVRVVLDKNGVDAYVTVGTLAMFVGERRMKSQMKDKHKKNDARVLGHGNLIQKVRKKIRGSNKRQRGLVCGELVFRDAQKIRLPFKCENPPVKKASYIPIYNLEKDGNNHMQFVMIMSIFFKSAEKRIKAEKEAQSDICEALSQDSGHSSVDYDTDELDAAMGGY